MLQKNKMADAVEEVNKSKRFGAVQIQVQVQIL